MKTNLYSPLFLFYAAKDFFENGTKAVKENFKKKENELINFDSLIHAKVCFPVINIAFSIELSIKGLLMYNKQDIPQNHDILDLFNLLDLEGRKKIIEHYQSHDTYKNYLALKIVNSANGSEHAKKSFLPAPHRDEKSLKKMLKQHRNYFKDFRYLYEMDDSKEKWILFREFSNFALSTLVVLGEKINITVQVNNGILTKSN